MVSRVLASMPYAIYAPNDIEGTIQGKVNLTNVPLIFKATREQHRFYRFLRMSFWNRKMLRQLKK